MGVAVRQPDVREEHEEHAVEGCVWEDDCVGTWIGSSTGQRDPGGRVREVRVPPRSVNDSSR